MTCMLYPWRARAMQGVHCGMCNANNNANNANNNNSSNDNNNTLSIMLYSPKAPSWRGPPWPAGSGAGCGQHPPPAEETAQQRVTLVSILVGTYAGSELATDL